MKTAKDWFEEELSGEPLTQESVIEVIKMIQEETWNEALDKAADSVRIEEPQYSNLTPRQLSKIKVSKQSILKLKL